MKNQIKNILVPVDLSKTSLNALNTGIQMAKRQKAQLHLLYVQDLMDYYPKMGRLTTLQPIMEDSWERNRKLLKKIVQSIRYSHEVNCSLEIVAGYKSVIIAEKAKELQIDVIVIGTEPDLSEQSYLIDSLPYKLLQNTISHVLIVPANKEVNAFDRIIFPVMSQENPIAKLQLSKSIIEKNNAVVTVVGIVKQQDLTLLKSIRDLSERIKRSLKMLAESVTRRSVYTLESAKEISDLSTVEKAKLIVLSGDTNRTLKEFFFGSFIQRMIRNTETAVLFVKGGNYAEKQSSETLKLAYVNISKLNHYAL